MAYYLVSARPLAPRMDDLEAKLIERAVWEEEDYCRPPLAQEREAVLDHYFEELSVELFPALVNR
jgi:hypothetical protein